jgi:arylamine N-acetyltransferase
MKNPDVHLISIVKIEDNEYIVDCGYAAPFLNPLPRNLKDDFIITHGNEKYIIKPIDELGRTKVEQYSDGKLQHWYIAKPEERKFLEFRKVIEDSYSDNAVFMNAVRITSYSENGSKVLKNFSFTETEGNEYKTRKINPRELASLIQANFGMPLIVVNEAIGSIKEIKDIYG